MTILVIDVPPPNGAWSGERFGRRIGYEKVGIPGCLSLFALTLTEVAN